MRLVVMRVMEKAEIMLVEMVVEQVGFAMVREAKQLMA